MLRMERKAAWRVWRRLKREDELVEVGLQVLASEAVVDAQRPGLEVGEDTMNPGQDDMGGHVSNDVRVVCDAGRAGVAGPAVGPGGGAGGEIGAEEGVQAVGGEVLDLRQADPAGATPRRPRQRRRPTVCLGGYACHRRSAGRPWSGKR